MWLGFIAITSAVGEWVISREVNGFLQLLSLAGLLGILMYIAGKTMDVLFKNQKK